jgi:hypothetical protein
LDGVKGFSTSRIFVESEVNSIDRVRKEGVIFLRVPAFLKKKAILTVCSLQTEEAIVLNWFFSLPEEDTALVKKQTRRKETGKTDFIR